jgi:hypothetical protein
MQRKAAGLSRLLALRHDLGVQVLALYLLLVIPVLTATLIFDRVAGQNIQAEVRTSDISLARAIAHAKGNFVAFGQFSGDGPLTRLVTFKVGRD